MKNKSLISVIVPIYKVQDFINECIEAIVNQTYSNLEIILVDDGSPDSCPIICDDWAKKDSRIKVIHKQNGGLSSARNAGLNAASGEFVSFVDSDDFLCKDALENLYDRIVENDKICIVSGMIYRYQDEKTSVFRKEWQISEEKIMTANEFFLATMRQTVSYTVWNKLYRKTVVDRIRFREGRNNEDTLFMYDLGKNIHKQDVYVVDIPKYVYYYRYREDSICTTSRKPLALDTLANYEDMMCDCKKINVQLYDVLYMQFVNKLCEFLDTLLLNPVWYSLYFTEYQKKLRTIPFKYAINNYRMKRVILIQLLKWNPMLAKMFRKYSK